jgi:hypothetical protein
VELTALFIDLKILVVAVRVQIFHYSNKKFRAIYMKYVAIKLKGIVSRDWKGQQMVSLDRFEV